MWQSSLDLLINLMQSANDVYRQVGVAGMWVCGERVCHLVLGDSVVMVTLYDYLLTSLTSLDTAASHTLLGVSRPVIVHITLNKITSYLSYVVDCLIQVWLCVLCVPGTSYVSSRAVCQWL